MIELPELVSAAKKAGLNEPQMTAEIPGGPFDIVFTAGALQYTDKPFQHLDRLLALEAPYLVPTRNFLSDEQRYFGHEANLFGNGIGPVPEEFTDRPLQFFLQTLPLNLVRTRIIEKYEILFEFNNESGMARTGAGLYDIDYLCRLREIKGTGAPSAGAIWSRKSEHESDAGQH